MALYRTSRDGAVIDNELLRLMAVEASFGRAGRVVIKSDAVMDEEIIQALYRASQAGVAIDLIVRGACCLRPGVEGLSKGIRVPSIPGRFLEHSRIYSFANGEGVRRDASLMGLADFMERNLDRRVEVLVPITSRDTRWRAQHRL